MGLFSMSDKFAMMGATAVDNQFLLEYMPRASGDAVKVYLYGLLACTAQMPDVSVDGRAHDLGMTKEEVLAAYRHWERVGLVERIGDNPLAFRYTPVNQSVFIGASGPKDPEYDRFTESVYAVFGNDRRLHGQTILQYYEWVTELGLPQEVVLMLLRHMISIKGKNFSYKAANKLACSMAEEHVQTIEDAEVALSRNREVLECSRAVLRKFSMRREPTEPEQDLCLKWMREWQYTKEAILSACDDTTAASVPSFKYLDGILDKRRNGETVTTQETYEKEREKEEKRREPLRKVYQALGRGASAINEGTLSVYWSIRDMIDDEDVVQFAAEQVGRANGKLEDVMNLVASWHKRGIGTREQAEVYVKVYEDEKKLLAALADAWGIRTPAGETNHNLVKKWRDRYRLPDEVILFAAKSARPEKGHMSYLDKILERYDARSIRTVEAAQADSAEFEAARASSGSRQQTEKPRKVVTEERYDQRENQEASGDAVPQWLVDWQNEEHETGEVSGHAQGNPPSVTE